MRRNGARCRHCLKAITYDARRNLWLSNGLAVCLKSRSGLHEP